MCSAISRLLTYLSTLSLEYDNNYVCRNSVNRAIQDCTHSPYDMSFLYEFTNLTFADTPKANSYPLWPLILVA